MRRRQATIVIVGALFTFLLLPAPARAHGIDLPQSSWIDSFFPTSEHLTRNSVVANETSDGSRFGTEPTSPYRITHKYDVRPCSTFEDESGPAIQFIYGYASDRPNRYASVYLDINKIISSIDFALDESAGNLDQDMRTFCRFRPPEGAAPDSWRQARLTPVDVGTERVNGHLTFEGIVSALRRQGFDRTDRIYVVFVDGDSTSQECSYGSDRVNCLGRNLGPMYATAELWDEGVVGHELSHALGAGHTTGAGAECPDTTRYVEDVMYGWWNYWQLDPGKDDYYDPSNLANGFDCGDHNYRDLAGWNVARSPFLWPPQAD